MNPKDVSERKTRLGASEQLLSQETRDRREIGVVIPPPAIGNTVIEQMMLPKVMVTIVVREFNLLPPPCWHFCVIGPTAR